MKKMIFTLVCLLGMSVAANAASKSDIVLQHGSNITVFNAEDLASAMEAAVDGDVIFLGEGSYPGFGITKKITIQGVGLNTVIKGDITIDIPNEPVLTAPVLQYLKAERTVTVKSETTGLGFKQCSIGDIVYKRKAFDAYIDRCFLYYLHIDQIYNVTLTINGQSSTVAYPEVKSLKVTNSIIGNVIGSQYSTTTTFVNCHIEFQAATFVLGTVINSIVTNGYSANYSISNTHLVNSYIRTNIQIESGCTQKNCYYGDNNLSYDSEELTTNGYLGNDGTIIGPLGGTTPYTLVPDVPQVTVSNFKVDHQKEELNVTLTATPE